MLGNYEDKTTPSNISLGNNIIAIAAMNMLEIGDHSLRRYLMPSETELAHICGVTPETAQGSLHLLWGKPIQHQLRPGPLSLRNGLF